MGEAREIGVFFPPLPSAAQTLARRLLRSQLPSPAALPRDAPPIRGSARAPIPMAAAAAGGGAGEAGARALLQRHQPFAPPPGEYHNFGAPAAAGDEMLEAVVLRTPVSSGGLVVESLC